MAAYTTIDNPELFFQVHTYTGTSDSNGDTQAITLPGDEDMAPDLVWIKNRGVNDYHANFDTVRGVRNSLAINDPHVEYDQQYELTVFGSDGYTWNGDDKGSQTDEIYVTWCWKAGTTSGIAGSPSITPSGYSFNATSGFSIIKYDANNTSGATLPHGLGVAPGMIIVKKLTGAADWQIYHRNNGETKYMSLNDAAVVQTATDRWNDVAPTTTLFSLGDAANTNGSGTWIAYCFADMQGYSKFGTYEGNGNADGTFVYTGFRPAFIMTKSVDSTSDWHMFDDKREGYNVDNDPLIANDRDVEATTDMIDIFSNGFKFMIATDPNVAETYIYAAFAKAPFVNSNGVPCNAR